MIPSIIENNNGGSITVCILLLVLISYNISMAHENFFTSIAHMSLFLKKEPDILHHFEDYIQKETIRLDQLSR